MKYNQPFQIDITTFEDAKMQTSLEKFVQKITEDDMKRMSEVEPPKNESDMYYVYFVYNGIDAIKIGIAKNVEKRVNELQTGNPRKLQIIDAFWANSKQTALMMEKSFHEMFSVFRMQGEWFEVSPVYNWWVWMNKQKYWDIPGFTFAHNDMK